MTLYFENPVNFAEADTITTDEVWHPTFPLLAVASYSQERGGFVTIFDDLGEPLRDVNFPYHSVSQVTALAWHPERQIFACGWENGELRVWTGEREFLNVVGPHQGPITILEFSEKGGRLVSCDTTGSLVGWKVDSRGEIITAFHHDLKDTITHVTFRLTIKSHPEFDVEGLAKAAVNGDERALDMFSNWRPKTTARKFRVQDGSDNTCFFVGIQSGVIYYINQGGACAEVLNTEGNPLAYILYHPNSDSIVVMMEGLTIGHFRVDFQGHLSELIKVKMSGRMQNMRGATNQGLVWCGGSSLAVLTGDLTVRVWDIDSNDNYVLPTTLKNFNNPSDDISRQMNEMFTCLAYCKVNQTICAGTHCGRIYFWVRTSSRKSREPEDSWELQNISGVTGTVKQLHWGTIQMRQPLLSVNCVTRVYIMKEQVLAACFTERIWATQRSANEILIETPEGRATVKCDLQVGDLSLTDEYLAVTNGRAIAVYSLSRKTAMTAIELGNFPCDNEKICLHNQNVIVMFQTGITIRSSSGAILSTIPVVTAEGEPIGMDLSGNNLVVFTMDGFLKVYDISDSEPKLTTPAKAMYDMVPDFGEIIQAKSNRTGNRIALSLADASLIPDGKLYLWNIEDDTLVNYDFYKSNEEDNEVDDYAKDASTEKNYQANLICSNRALITICWDIDDPRLLCCNAKKRSVTAKDRQLMEGIKISRKINQKPLELEEQVLVTMFYSQDRGLSIQDVRATDVDARLLGIATPYIATLQKLSVHRELMNDFNGLELCNKATKEAVLDFSYYLSLGNMDEAFKAIKLVQSTSVWGSLARMCVKTRRLDVAGVCLGHMGNARSARALRLAMQDDSLSFEAKLSELAIQLGMLEEAEQLLTEANRFDLLNQLYRRRNRLDLCIKIAQDVDRIHLRNTEHATARVLEQDGRLREAIPHYENAVTHGSNVPRMLAEHPELLQEHMSKTSDPELLKWWGQYNESQGDMQTALEIYAKANDTYNQVRVLTFLGEESRAADLARSGNDKAALYHMAHCYESVGNIENAVAFFMRANAYYNAVRLCKEQNLLEELWLLGSIAGNRQIIECARHFEEMGVLDKAVTLYHRGGMMHKALDLAYRTHLNDTLQTIATDLHADSDPLLIKQCAEFFIVNEEYDKAVDLYAIGKKYGEAIDICLNHNVQLTEELAEKLTPEKDEVNEEQRLHILTSLANALMAQGQYYIATKKYTQAGDKLKAMKALLKSGDTQKIVFFAGVSRQREIYIMAANYLQSLDWQNQPDILKNIITFYSKGKALDLLANFYVACAHVEIDEFQNYEKALGALTEAQRALAKVAQPSDPIAHRRATEIMQQQLTAVKRFVDIKRLFERGDYTTGVQQCKLLLSSGSDELETSVRLGDIYALMIQMSIKHDKFPQAKQFFLELRQILASTTQTPITYFVNKDLVEALAKGLNIPTTALVPNLSKANDSMNEEEEISEEVVEE